MRNKSPGDSGSCINTTDLSDFEPVLHDLADCSADVIMPFFRSKLDVDEKHDKGIYDPVTKADRGAEQVMRDLITQHFEDHGVIGEEFPNKDPDADLCWVFDPIDGTRAFIIGAPTWGTLIGLSHKGQPRLGMMNQPFTGERFWGSDNGAFYRCRDQETKSLATSTVSDLSRAVLSSTAPEHFSHKDGWEKFQTLSNQTRMTRYGYDCYAYCLLSLGLVDIVAEAGLATYDIAPLVPIIRAAGGIVTTWDNGDPTQGGEILASANQELHDKALALLSQS
ncbi:MAG: histidinol-phosphatase [bacterium]|nr:histidinol-phosphatase [bacterium]